jgi:hypothetical protein
MTAETQERIGLSHEDALNLRISGMIQALAWVAIMATKSPQKCLNKSHPEALYWRGKQVRRLATDLDAIIRELSSIQDFDHEFAEPCATAAEIFAEKMENASFRQGENQ